MNEPSILSQLFGVSVTFIGIFVIMLFTCRYECKEEKQIIIIEEADDFLSIARQNLKKSDKKFTYDCEPPIGLPSTIEDLPSDLKMCVEDYDRLANDYQEETRNNDILKRQNTSLLEENGRLLYKEMTMDFRKNKRKWRVRA